MGISIYRIERLVQRFVGGLSNENRDHFFSGFRFNPLKVLSLTSSIPSLDLKGETLILLYSSKADSDSIDIALTDKGIHHSGGVLDDLSAKSFKELEWPQCVPHHVSLMEQFLVELESVRSAENKDLNSFTAKFKDFVNQKQASQADYEIDYAFIEILRTEGQKVTGLAADLNADNRFSNAINQMINQGDDPVEFRAEHIILQDVIRVYNLIVSDAGESRSSTSRKSKFALAYLFEKLQGNDIIQSLSVKGINEFVKSPRFDENIAKIQSATLFDLGAEYKDEFFLPSVIKRIDTQHFGLSSSFLYRFASLLAKADGTVTDRETAILKQINHQVFNPKVKLEGIKRSDVDHSESLEEVLAELDELIGLENIKKAIRDLSNFLKVQKEREKHGLKQVSNSLHSVFMGPPGTGKTTVARLLSKIYRHLGYLDSGHLVETDRTGLVAGYVGQTALKVDKVVKASLNGVLFVDEAYSLATENRKDFGNEAIEVLLKKMEDHRDELVVIVAGYPDEMKSFIQSNPGLESRFNRYFNFDHFRAEELMAIFELFCTKSDFELTADAKDKLQFIFDKLYERRHDSFGNARTARNLFEKIIEQQANRLASVTPLTEELLRTIEEPDVPPVNQTVDELIPFQDEPNG